MAEQKESNVPEFDMELEFERAKEAMRPFENGAANEVRRATEAPEVETTVNLIASSGNYAEDSAAAREREREADRGMLDDDEYLRRELEARKQQYERVTVNPLVVEPKNEGDTFEARVEQTVVSDEAGGATGEGGESEAAVDRKSPSSAHMSRQASSSPQPATVIQTEPNVVRSDSAQRGMGGQDKE